MRRASLGILILSAALGLAAQPASAPASQQGPAPTPAQKELAQPLGMEDGKPTPPTAVPEPSGWRTFGSLLIVAGMAGGSLWALKKWGRGRLPGSGGGKLRIEETLALGERRFVSILACEGERYLLALTPQGIRLLSRLDGLPTGPSAEFGDVLEDQMALPHPLPVREAEALIKGGR